jgi:2-dehydro-3-deoxy-D-arabinonate dehydratase
VGVVEGTRWRWLTVPNLASVLHAADPVGTVLAHRSDQTAPLDTLTLLPPLEQHEVWAAGVTYKRSQEARERESAGAGQFYDLVYHAPRPELFFKATAPRVVGPGGPVRIRQDAKWNVPEPELALVISPDLRIVGYTIGNDMSSRDIEGENPLYLPQAKLYKQSCALGPWITLAPAFPATEAVTIHLRIERGTASAFVGETPLSRMKRTPTELVEWLGRDNEFPQGVVLLTGTGIIPPDDFTLLAGDRVSIGITGIGTLTNTVVCG